LRRHINDKINAKFAIDIMTKNPTYISPLIFAKDALDLIKNEKITNIPVVLNNIVKGIVHIHDLLRNGVS
jgi:arabinose-5-phosphate isomerase